MCTQNPSLKLECSIFAQSGENHIYKVFEGPKFRRKNETKIKKKYEHVQSEEQMIKDDLQLTKNSLTKIENV